MDYHSVPQRNRTLQALAISTLQFIAFSFSIIAIDALSSSHVVTQLGLRFDTLSRRVWCRAEVLSFYCSRGVEDMHNSLDSVSIARVLT